MGFATESFDRILQKLENYGIQNKIESITDSDILKLPVTLMYTRSINSDVKPNCYAKNNSSNHQSKAIGSTSKHQHLSNLTMTEEDEDAIKAIYDRYPDLHL
ncbi:hypothetical protein KEM48_010626 [Puccinia striiformis f. sp. tritici PST-130]|nr:hypothetical protein KEM48_010626 [Puccinia striiformis f. sp. tritici PST-130]